MPNNIKKFDVANINMPKLNCWSVPRVFSLDVYSSAGQKDRIANNERTASTGRPCTDPTHQNYDPTRRRCFNRSPS